MANEFTFVNDMLNFYTAADKMSVNQTPLEGLHSVPRVGEHVNLPGIVGSGVGFGVGFVVERVHYNFVSAGIDKEVRLSGITVYVRRAG